MLPLPLLAAFLLAAPRYAPAPNGGEERLTYLHDLASPTARLTLAGGGLSWDPEAKEVFFTWGDEVRVFNEAGLEVHRFADLAGLGRPLQVAALPGGDLLLRVQRDGVSSLVRCDFRGRPLGPFTPTGLPAGVDLAGSAVLRAGDRLWFFDAARLRAVATDLTGAFKELVDLGAREELGAVGDGDREVRGFAVGAQGALYVGFPMLFYVAVLDAERTMKGFGQKGSAAGKFNVISDVAVDEEGYVYVADVLKGAVLIFNPLHRFVGQVSGLTLPTALLAAGGRLLVSQGGKEGVAVFQVRRR